MKIENQELYEKVYMDCKHAICDVLDQEDIDGDENFFFMGIESVSMTKVVADLEELYHVSIQYEDFMDNATLNEFAQFLTELIEANSSESYLQKMNYQVDRSKWGEPFKLSELQEAYYVGRIQEYEYNGIPTNGYMEMTCDDFDYYRFYNALLKLINRHPMLRCYFDDEGYQHTLDNIEFYYIEVIDLKNCSKEEKEPKLLEVRHEMVNMRVDIYEAPLLITKISLLDDKQAVLHFYVDALVMDGWSYEVFHKELEELYSDENITLRELGVTYQDYIDFKSKFKLTEKYAEDKEFWMRRIEDMPDAATLPEMRELSSIVDKVGSQVECELDIYIWRKIETSARNHNVTPFSVLFSTFVLVVSRWNYKQRLLFNIPEFDRPMFHEDMDKILGVCSAFLLFTSDNREKLTFSEFVRKTQDELTALIQHHGFSGIEISREMYKITGEHDKALAPLVFGMLPDLPHKDKELLKVRYQENHTSQVWIDINTCVYDDCIQFNWNFIDQHLSQEMLQNMVVLQKELLFRIADGDDIWNEKIELELPEEDKKIINSSNDTHEEIVKKTIPQVIYESLQANKENTCVITEKQEYTYNEIEKIMYSFACDLKEMGCEKGDRIIVYMPKGIRQVCMVLAISYIGAIYVPIDYQYPFNMLKKCADNVGAKIIVTSHEKSVIFSDEKLYIPDINNVKEVEGFMPAEVENDDIITIIHTSGSTGIPKAVIVTNEGLYNSIFFTNRRFNVNNTDRCIALTNLAHDMEMYDIFGMLMAGASILMPYQESSIDPEYWISKMKKHQVTIWNSVPAFANMILDTMTQDDRKALEHLRLMILGGDYVKCETVQTIWNYNNTTTIVSVGGPTETTLWNIYHVVTKEDLQNGVIPYGKPIINTKYYLLNEKREEVPVGVVGMMYCTGVGITKGYWNNEDSTAEKYSIYKKTGERIYETGDLGKYNEAGDIIFCGREDLQVNINGKRIELNEITTVLRSMEGIKDCIVLFKKEEKKLVAFFIADEEIESTKIQEYLLQMLPKYMIPSSFARLEKLPLTRNGKIDTRKLLSMKMEFSIESQESREIKTELERNIVEICKEHLMTEVSLDSEFFMVGGDSLLAVKLLARLRDKYRISLSLTELYGKNTIGDWCDLIEQKLNSTGDNADERSEAAIGVNKWIGHGNINVDKDKLHLICIPHAGSSAMFFTNWNKYFSDKIQILPLQYPGRENRINEEMYDSIEKMAKDFVEECPEVFEGKFAIFGHCTGSIVGYEILKLLKTKYKKDAVLFIVSSNSAPIHPIIESTKNATDAEFVKGLADYGFIDPALFELEDFSTYYLPIIRHDFDMQENYICNEQVVLDTPLYVFSGKDDPSMTDYEKVLDWKDFTTKSFGNKIFEGSHFYMEENLEEFCGLVESVIEEEN